MKLFKNIDEKFEEIGFVKIKEDKYGALYERENKKYGYIHVIDIMHKKSGSHIFLSYDKDLFDIKGIGNCGVGLTYYETKLVLKKFKKLNKMWNKLN